MAAGFLTQMKSAAWTAVSRPIGGKRPRVSQASVAIDVGADWCYPIDRASRADTNDAGDHRAALVYRPSGRGPHRYGRVLQPEGPTATMASRRCRNQYPENRTLATHASAFGGAQWSWVNTSGGGVRWLLCSRGLRVGRCG